MTGNASGEIAAGRPARELSDEELESQGTQAHATRNWVFLHGTAEQFAHHTSRMFELEQEFLRRHPHRTWQGSGGAPDGRGDEVAALREALRAVVLQLDALASEPIRETHRALSAADPELLVLSAIAASPGGRMHKLEVHQAAREANLDRAALAALYTAANPLLITDQHDRVITAAGRERLRRADRRRSAPPPPYSGPWTWQHQERPVWDGDKQRVIGDAPGGIFDLRYEPGEGLAGDWWAAADNLGRIVAFGWMDVTWGEAEILLAVDPGAQEAGLGSFVLDNLEREAATQGLNYVYNTVRDTHPDRDLMHDWLGVRGYRGQGGALRKRVLGRTSPPVDPPAPTSPKHPDVSADIGPGREDSGGYVDVDDHQY